MFSTFIGHIEVGDHEANGMRPSKALVGALSMCGHGYMFGKVYKIKVLNTNSLIGD